MTVSPRRAQDGQHLPSDSRQSSDRVSSEMPPILFKLPNLNPTAHQPTDWDQPLPAVPSEPAEVNAPTVTEAPEIVGSRADSAAPTADGVQTGPVVSPSQPTLQAPPTGTPGPFSTNATDDSIPMGRTWMERVGSHGLILSMLLIVVAAAVLTGRNTGDPADSDGAVAASVGREIQFDSQGQIELPIPDHLHLSEPVEVAHDHSAAMSAIDYVDPRVSEPFGFAEERTITQKLSFGQDHASVPSEALTADPIGIAALSKPQVNRSDSFTSAHEDSAAAGVSEPDPGVATNRLYDGSTSVGATTVSNRTVMEDEALAVPTLEDLESSAGITSAARPFDGPSFSRTPFGLADSDLLLHLDEMIQRSSTSTTRNAASRYSAAGSPTHSN